MLSYTLITCFTLLKIFSGMIMMESLRFYVLFSSISVISGRYYGENERQCVFLLGTAHVSNLFMYQKKTFR